MSDIDTPVADTEDDLDTFASELFNPSESEGVEDSTVEEEDQDGEDTEDTVEETDAEEDEDTSDEDDSEDSTEEEEPEDKPRKNRKSAKERISELVAERRAAEARAAALELRLQELEANRNKTEDTPKPKDVVEDSFPDPEALDESGEPIYPLGVFDPKYNADVTKYNTQQALAEFRRQQEEEAKAAERTQKEAELVANWNDKLEETSQEIPDLREKIQGLEDTFVDIDPDYGTFLAQTIMGMDRGVEVLYYLAENPEVAEDIVSSNPVAATIALGRLEGMLPGKTKETPKKVSKAPPPPKVAKGTSASKRVSGDTDDLDAFAREFFKKR